MTKPTTPQASPNSSVLVLSSVPMIANAPTASSSSNGVISSPACNPNRPNNCPPKNRLTISAIKPEEVAALGEHAVAAGFSTVKLKVGFADDRWRLEALRDAVGFQTLIRLDANGGWYTGEAIEQIQELQEYGLELIEQPVAPDDLAAMHRVRDASMVPIVADEGVRSVEDLDLHIAPETSHLSARARFTVTNEGKEPLKALTLQLSSTLSWESIGAPAPLTFTQHTLDTDADHTGQVTEALVDPLRQNLPTPTTSAAPSAAAT